MPFIRCRLLILVCAAVLIAAAPHAWAQSYPNRPVRVIVPAGAGGPTDLIARIVAQKLTERLGQQFYVENFPSGAGNPGMGMVAKAPPDGYTLLFVPSQIVINPGLYAKLPYDSLKDFAPITLAATSPLILVVHPGLAANNVKELIALAKADPGKYSYASPGTGTASHLASELFRLSFGLDLIHVPFNGAAPSIVSTVGGHTPIVFSAVAGVASNVREGKLRALGVMGSTRSPALAEVPTMTEAGVSVPDASLLQGLVAPTGTPKEIIDQLHREVARIVVLPDVKERFTALGFVPVANTPAEFAGQLRAEVARWANVIRDANIKKIE